MDTTPLVRPNSSSGTPVYIQLMDQVKHGLETGALRPGDPLPDVLPLAEALVVHPNAVVRAYRELEALRFVARSAGVLRAASSGPAPRLATLARRLLPELAAENLGAQIALDAADRAARVREIDAARDVQQRLLPQSLPPIDGLDYAGASRQALGVGGDYYDFLQLPSHCLAIAVGDVCGKGVPAALLMAALRAYLHGAMPQCQGAPRELVTAINRLVYDSMPDNRFATFFYGLYDRATRTLEYVNAGHNAPILLRPLNGAWQRHRLDATGMAIGLMPDTKYESRRLTLETGDVLVAYTDGVSEAMNANGDEWGDDRLVALLEAGRWRSAREVADTVWAGADEFAAGTSQYDDMTLVVVRVT
jgi:sigma-B regulation protein RsbU (phosphoserine phosphatase)